MSIWQRIFGTKDVQAPPENNTASQHYNTACFICEAKIRPPLEEKPYKWFKPRMACAKHSAYAALESEELVEEFLGRHNSNDFPLEGSGLNYFINPVTINGIRGWNDFVAGGRGVIEEVFPSLNYFEFFAQHSLNALDGFYALYERRELLSSEMSFMKVQRDFDTESKQMCLSNLLFVWDSMRAIQEALIIRGKVNIESPDEVEEVLSAAHDLAADHSVEMVVLLLELGKKRFAHLSSEA
jgi:hypothetical protein